MDKPLTSAVFIAEARDSTMWTVLWTVWTDTERTKGLSPCPLRRGSLEQEPLDHPHLSSPYYGEGAEYQSKLCSLLPLRLAQDVPFGKALDEKKGKVEGDGLGASTVEKKLSFKSQKSIDIKDKNP